MSIAEFRSAFGDFGIEEFSPAVVATNLEYSVAYFGNGVGILVVLEIDSLWWLP